MKQTSDKLEFVEMSAFWIVLFVGGAFFITGLLLGSVSGNFWAYLFAPLGLIIMALAQIETIIFDKNLGHMSIKRHQPLIAKTKLTKHLIQDISGVEIQQIESSNSSNDNTSTTTICYRVCLVLHSGKQRVPLTSGFTTGLGSKDKTAEVIATFLNIRNYGLECFPTDDSNELKWDSIEEEITHWKTVIKSDANDADARLKLGLALMLQDATNNKEEAMGYLKKAETLFKAQGYDEEAMQAAQVYGMAHWGMLGK